MLSRVAPWLASRKDVPDPPGISVRTLDGDDTAALVLLAQRDPVSNVFILAHLRATGTAAPTSGGAGVLGVFDDGVLALMRIKAGAVRDCDSGASQSPSGQPP